MSEPFPNRAVMLYDGDCAFCCKGVSILKKLDWRGTLVYHDARDMAGVPDNSASLNQEAMLEEMHLLTPDRQRAYVGYNAFRWMAWRFPATMLIAPLLYIPGVPWLGSKVYRWVARNRFKIIPCNEQGCKVHAPEKKTAA